MGLLLRSGTAIVTTLIAAPGLRNQGDMREGSDRAMEAALKFGTTALESGLPDTGRVRIGMRQRIKNRSQNL